MVGSISPLSGWTRAGHPHRDAEGALTHTSLPGWMSQAMAAVLAWMLRAAIAAPMAVAVHRFILLGEVRRFIFFPGPSLRCAGVCAGFSDNAVLADPVRHGRDGPSLL